jgi:DNA-binding SARP family transcriptional activator/tetratricopeptide (TPR) repeat protein
MEFEFLGPLRVRGDLTEVAVSAPMSRRLLAVLLCHPNTPVSTDQLADVLWPDQLSGAEQSKQLQVQVYRLRRALGDPSRVRFEQGSYTLVVHPGELDAERFETLLTEGMEIAGSADPAWGTELLRKALALWRGDPFGDLADLPMLRQEAARLNERRMVGFQELYAAELAAGRHAAIVADLSELAVAYPLRERLQGLLMTALYRCGRQAEALEVYRRTRAVLVDELGVEPAGELQRLHQSILEADPELESSAAQKAAAAPPAQLPADTTDFTGRTEHLTKLRDLLAPGEDAAVTISAITGKPGVGKTTLAVHAAHLLRDNFPDGQLYVDLRGTETNPVAPSEVLARFLRALGLDGSAIPDDLEERAAIYRSRLANKRVLVLLDNASTAAQLRPMLPGMPGSAVLVTSRTRIVDLGSIRLIDLDILSPSQAVELLGRIIGEQRVAAEHEQATQIVKLCGYLPLAVIIAAARLAAHPHWRLSRLVRALSDEQRRLDELAVGDLEVRASLTLSYTGLDAAAQRTFCLLGLLEQADVAGWVVAALLDSSVEEAEELIDRLLDAQLLEVAGEDATGQPRYRLHDLVRVFARERALAEQTPQQRAEAIERVLGCWLSLVEQASRRELSRAYWVASGSSPRWPLPEDVTAELLADSFAWFDAERVSLTTAVEQAAALGLHEVAWELASALRLFQRVRGYTDDWQRTNAVALEAVRKAGNRRGEVVMTHGQGQLQAVQHNYDEALSCLEQATEGYVEVHEPTGAARLLGDIGRLYFQLGRFDAATACYERAMTTFNEMGDEFGEAQARCDIGRHYNKLGRSELAVQYVEPAVRTFQRRGNKYGEALARYVICESLVDQGRAAEARGNLESALLVCAEAGYRFGEARILFKLGSVHHADGRLEEAVDCLERGVAISEELNNGRDSAYGQQQLGVVYSAQGRRPEAQAMCQRCLQTFRELQDRHGEALTLRVLGRLYQAEERFALAVACLKEALHKWQQTDLVVWQARTLRDLAEVHDAAGDTDAAALAFAESDRLMNGQEPTDAPDLVLHGEQPL